MNPPVLKKKILFVITKSNFGGAQKYVFDLAIGLPRNKFDVVVALGGTGLLSDKLRTAGIRTISLPSLERNINPLKDLSSFIALVKLFKIEAPDVVHLNSAKASGLGALAGRLSGVPKIIFTAHGWAFKEERSWLSRMIITALSWATILLAHRTIAVSEAVYRDTHGWPLISAKVTTIHNGIGSIEFLPRDNARRNIGGRAGVLLPEDTFLVGSIGELHPNKGFIYAIDAMAQLSPENPNLYYIILGDGEEKKLLSNLIEARGLRGRVFLIKEEHASYYLKAFDCFLVPSNKEGLPYVLLEAGLASIPVVATTVGGIPEIIEYAETGFLVSPRDSQAIANSIEQLIVSPALRTTLSTALHERVVKEFSLARALAETVSLYTKK